MEATSAATVSESASTQVLPFEFTGRAAEYFRIWIVNLALAIVTLGVYTAWAKVRTTRYFHGNTRLSGAAFAYTAEPAAILRGRAIAFLILIAYSTATELLPAAGVVLGLALAATVPWLIVRSLAFRAYHTTYRNVRFHFAREYGRCARAYFFYPALSLCSLGLLYPLAQHAQKRFVVDHASYGTTPFRLHAPAREFFAIYARVPLYLALCVLGIALAPRAALPAFGIVALYGYCDVTAAATNLVYDRTTLGPHRFESALEPWRLALYHATNGVGVLLSLGLLVPWARVRIARYRASCLRLRVAGSLDDFAAAEGAAVSALGEEVGDLFDTDVALPF